MLYWEYTFIMKLLLFFKVLYLLFLKWTCKYIMNLQIMHFELNIINILSIELLMKKPTLSQAANTIVGVIQALENHKKR